MNPPSAPPKRDFLGKPAPPGYVAGVGRGAAGFTTRSDIGPARDFAAAGRGAGFSSGAGPSRVGAKRDGNQDDEDDEAYLNESNYDEFAGYGGSLFNKDPYEEDDEEADKIYEAIDKHLDERGKALREAKTRQELELYRQKRPKLQRQFTDLKPQLSQVTDEEWMNLPDVGDSRNRKQRVARQDKFTPVPDSILAHQARLASGGENLVYIDPKTIDNDGSDDEGDLGPKQGDSDSSKQQVEFKRPFAPPTDEVINIGEMSEFRSSYMTMQLNRVATSTEEGQSASKANPQDYLTNLQAMAPNQITDATTLKEYRKQFASLRKSNPTFTNAWIASIRLEEAAGKLKSARSLVLEACEKCPKSADIWCEAVRLHPPDIAKALMVRALKELPRSVKLWCKAADLETDDSAKQKVYSKARELLPKCVLLWKKSVELEQPDEARKILREAVECCPESVELWLALARLESYEDAQQVLVKASERNPTDRSIWLTAAKLEEAAGNRSRVEGIIHKAIEQLTARGVEVKRDEWYCEALDADRAGFKVTANEIIRRLLNWNLNELDKEAKLKFWLEEAKKFIASKSVNCARSIYMSITEQKSYCKLQSLWLTWADLERQHQSSGSDKQLEQLLRKAVRNDNCSKSETLWLMLADERRQHLSECRQILSDALDANPDSERIILKAVELECDNGNHKEARRILADACMSAKTATLVMRAAKLEWSLGNLDEAVRMLVEGTQEHRTFGDFYLALGQIEEQRGANEAAKGHYKSGLRYDPSNVDLWIHAAHLEERTGHLASARSKLEMARIRNPRQARLWLEAARLEVRAHLAKKSVHPSSVGRPDMALNLLAKGIRELKGQPDVGQLEAEQLLINKRKFI